MGKVKASFREGVYLGMRGGSNDKWVGDVETGSVVKSRTLKRVPETRRWSIEAIKKNRGKPWDLDGRRPDGAASGSAAEGPRIDDEEGVGAQEGSEAQSRPIEPRTVERDECPIAVPRSWRITPRVLTKFGYTSGCSGCEAARAGKAPRGHHDECRRRLEQRLVETEDIEIDRVREAERRMTEGLARAVSRGTSRGGGEPTLSGGSYSGCPRPAPTDVGGAGTGVSDEGALETRTSVDEDGETVGTGVSTRPTPQLRTMQSSTTTTWATAGSCS